MSAPSFISLHIDLSYPFTVGFTGGVCLPLCLAFKLNLAFMRLSKHLLNLFEAEIIRGFQPHSSVMFSSAPSINTSTHLVLLYLHTFIRALWPTICVHGLWTLGLLCHLSLGFICAPAFKSSYCSVITPYWCMNQCSLTKFICKINICSSSYQFLKTL